VSPRPRGVSDDQVFAATAKVVSRDGPGQLTVAAVAKEAGLAPSSLVERYGTKRELLLAFAASAPADVRRAFDRARIRHPDPHEALRTALVDLTSSIRTRKAMANHLAFLQMDLSDADFRRHAIVHGDSLRMEIASLIAQMPAARGSKAMALERAKAVQIAFNGALVTWAIHGEGTLPEAIEQALHIALREQ
jgi:AcrR family transcriptional regulator